MREIAKCDILYANVMFDLKCDNSSKWDFPKCVFFDVLMECENCDF